MRLRCDHLHLYTADIDATARWYERVLGASILRTRQSDGRVRTDLQLEGMTLYLSDARKLEANLGWKLNQAAPSPRYGLDHFGLAVDDLEEAARLLIERGARITYGPRTLRPGAACLYLEAPDGVIIEVIARDMTIDSQPVD